MKSGEKLIAKAVYIATNKGFRSCLYDSTLINIIRNMTEDEIKNAIRHEEFIENVL